MTMFLVKYSFLLLVVILGTMIQTSTLASKKRFDVLFFFTPNEGVFHHLIHWRALTKSQHGRSWFIQTSIGLVWHL